MKKDLHRLPELPCACASLRRAARALTQFYAEEVRPLGLHATQFTILQALMLTGEINQGALGEVLAIDSTTLTRTLRIMLREGWIAERRGEDRRERLISITDAGRKLYEAAVPGWEKSQRKLRQRLGDKRWSELFIVTNEVTSLTV